jgi:hypothetical protein
MAAAGIEAAGVEAGAGVEKPKPRPDVQVFRSNS